MDGNTRPPIHGSQARWQNTQQVFFNDANAVNPPEASWQQQQAPHSNGTPFVTEPQQINLYGDAYRDNLPEFTESLDDPGYFGQTQAAMLQQHLLAPVNPAMEMGMAQPHSFQATANAPAGVDLTAMNNYYAPPAAGYNANEVPGPGFETPTLMLTPNTPTTQGNVRINWTRDQDLFLLRMKDEGRTYPEIAVEMAKSWPSMGSIKPNSLTKRMRKIRDQALDKFPRAVKTMAMPRIIACIQDVADSLGIDDDMCTEIMSEIKRILPNIIQKKLTARRARQLNTSPARGAQS